MKEGSHQVVFFHYFFGGYIQFEYISTYSEKLSRKNIKY
jgi:hypothetical protein